MRILPGLALTALLLVSSCATWSVQTTDITLQPGGRVHVHGRALEVEVISQGPGMLAIRMQDSEGSGLGGATLGVGRWSGGDRRVTDVWVQNDSGSVVKLDVRAGGSGTVAVATLEEPVESR